MHPSASTRCLSRRPRSSHAGFTLIEVLTVVSVIAILLALAAPNLRDFIVKSKVSGLSNEFSGALLQTRALAISNNSCVTVCAATSISASSTGSCSSASSNDFQSGWIIFKNPSCDATQTDPTAAGGLVLAARQGESNGYQIKPADNALSSIMFDPRGGAALASQGLIHVLPPTGGATTFSRNICIDASGRASVHKYHATQCL